MLQYLTPFRLTKISQIIFRSPYDAVSHVTGPRVGSRLLSTLTERAYAIKAACTRPDCRCTEGRIKQWLEQNDQRDVTAAKLRALGAENLLTKYDPQDDHSVRMVHEWYSKGPPPLSEYTLSFGKHKGKRLDQVPDQYLVKYMIPRHGALHYAGYRRDPLVYDALADFLKRNPDLKSQAGRAKTVVRDGGVLTPPPRKKPGRPRKYSLQDSV